MQNLKDKKIFLFDLDGTLYLGGEPIGDAINTLKFLRQKGKKIGYITNNSSRTDDQYEKILRDIGIFQDGDFIYSSLDATIDYILEHRKNDKIFALCPKRVFNCLKNSGINVVEEQDGKYADDLLLAFDTELTYSKIKLANELLNKGAYYIATHPDLVCPTKDISIPDVGSFISLLKTSSGRVPDLIIGKPNSLMAEYICTKYGVCNTDVVMVGDRLSTDIKFGINCNFTTILVLSGDTDKKTAEDSIVKPYVIIDDVNCLPKLI